MSTVTIPGARVNVVSTDPNTGVTTFDKSWSAFFQAIAAQLTAKPGAVAAATVSASPFAYTASANGTVVVSGGTVTDMTLTRGTAVTDLGATGSLAPMSAGDVLTITYTAAPAVTFVPT